MVAWVSARPRWYWMYAQAASWFRLDFMIASAEPPSFAERAPPAVHAGNGNTPQSPPVFGAMKLFRNVPIQTAIGSVATLPSPIALYHGSVHSGMSPRVPAFQSLPRNSSALR